MPITHSTAGVADTFAYKQALELGTGVNVAKKSGFKSWLTHLRLHRALVVAKESELTRELRQMRQAHRRETRFNPQSTVGILDDTHLPTLVATEGARKASEELRK
ncbi:hypothetical protein Pmar_PMAR002079 [Perkinsus marinus ATCC 50983]|uniref:Uncharacterized protein n=1 Tax=Perkinsus marinus (strain ATCC 50983 / TXsc) TaxID=423536 RepID=C5LYM1_PERM5|nr:hypothetical protein Pmar_PMAR002079 [Perkinsus marinus ATCC 50983]EEQ98259.1 hypothetical protein Pmar_PMAR002079 [Perkinsus marinus ATCC 50983]|eukprot:XP_002765542.1 hypothetical protein Pmar_PMAR002079 [Perkinsus marinus ATCC 50983]